MAKRKNDLVKTDTGYYDPVTQTTFKTTDTGQLADAETGEVIKDEVDMYDRFTKVFDGPFRTPLWKTPWNHDTDAEAARTGLSTTDVTKTQQHSQLRPTSTTSSPSSSKQDTSRSRETPSTKTWSRNTTSRPG